MYLANQYELDFKYMISIHDEVAWIVKKEHSALFAYVWQVAHLWTRAFFYFTQGFVDVPATVAFFDAVDIDFTLRKSVKAECTTPSQPDPLPKGIEKTLPQILTAVEGKI